MRDSIICPACNDDIGEVPNVPDYGLRIDAVQSFMEEHLPMCSAPVSHPKVKGVDDV